MTTTDTVSPDDAEKTRKTAARIESQILRRLADITQARAAECMGVSASTVSRMTDDIGRVSQLLAAIGMQVAASDSVVADRAEQIAMKHLAFKWLQAELEREGRL